MQGALVTSSFLQKKGGGGYEYISGNIINDNVFNVSCIVALLDYFDNQAQ